MFNRHYPKRRLLLALSFFLLTILPVSATKPDTPPPIAVSPAANTAISYPPSWNSDTRYPLVYAENGIAWYADSESVKTSTNDAAEIIFSVDIFMVNISSDLSAFEFQRYWFRRVRADDANLFYVRHGDVGEWIPLSLSDTVPDRQADRSIFLAGWQSAVGAAYTASH